jgi:hypothetical protein
MSDKKTEAKGELVANPASTAIGEVLPSFIEQGERTGTEHLREQDIQMPRLALAQLTSPEIDPEDPKFIEGLVFGDLFNSLTRENYKTGPMKFCIVRADRPRYIEFTPDGKQVVDMNVPEGDPRTLFGPAGEKPVATKFFDFVIMLLPSRELIALSFKSTGLKVAKQLNGLITFRGNIKLFAGIYTIVSMLTKNTKGRFAIYKVANAGVHQDENTYNFAKAAFEAFRHKEVVIDRGGMDNDDPDAFDTKAMDHSNEPGSM